MLIFTIKHPGEQIKDIVITKPNHYKNKDSFTLRQNGSNPILFDLEKIEDGNELKYFIKEANQKINNNWTNQTNFFRQATIEVEERPQVIKTKTYTIVIEETDDGMTREYRSAKGFSNAQEIIGVLQMVILDMYNQMRHPEQYNKKRETKRTFENDEVFVETTDKSKE